MDKSTIIQKTVETLAPFETANLMRFMQELTVKDAINSPWLIAIFAITAFYAIVVRSKFVLSVLFTAISLLILIRYTMPAEGDGLSVTSTIPFAFGGLAIGAVLIYLNFIKTE